ncbi:MAG: DUF2817 domain-containing protein [Gaiellaceae bacterium]
MRNSSPRSAATVAAFAVASMLSLTAVALASHPDRLVSRTESLGLSALGRPLFVLERGDPDARFKELVVGCIHGNEPAGIQIAELLESTPLPHETALFVVENANPDGVAANTRTNGHGVDLNRNFPWHWYRHGARGDPHYSGPRALSEPESRALARLIARVRPSITIWFHQPLGLVDESGGSVAVERRFAALVHLPLLRLPRYGGGATDWQDHRFPGTTGFVVELAPGPLTRSAASRYARAAVALIRGQG